jgi:hypothetical protein
LISGRASGREVTGISPVEEEAAQDIINRLRTGEPYASKGEQEVGEGYMRTVEGKEIVARRAEVLFGGIMEKPVVATVGYAPTVTIATGLQRMFTMPPWKTEGALSGEKEYGEIFGHPKKHRWQWSNSEFELLSHLMHCTSIPYARG